MGIGDIIEKHKPAEKLSRDEKNAEQEKLDEIVKELVPEVPKPKRNPPGRPRKNSTGSAAPPKSPGRQQPADQDQGPITATTPEAIADQIKKKSVLRQLRVYCRRFPEYAPPPEFNPHLCSAAQLQSVIDAIVEAVGADVEYLTTPMAISTGIQQAERGAMIWAMSNMDHPLSPVIGSFHNAATNILSDPAVDKDIGLLECKLTGKLPDSPYFRLGLNIGRILLTMFTEHKIRAPVELQQNLSKFEQY